MNTLRIAAAGIAVLLLIPISAEASQHKHHHRNTVVSDANGNAAGPGVVRSHKTGATAHVGSSHAAAFQAYIDELESRGATIRFMGGIRRGHCWSGGLHPCGKALDVCQLSRGRVDHKCNLPGRIEIASIAARHGLFEGGQWCHSDYGHAQVGVSAEACGERTLMARSHMRRRQQVAYSQPETPTVDRLAIH